MKTFEVILNAPVISDETYKVWIDKLSERYNVVSHKRVNNNVFYVTIANKVSKADLKLSWMVERVTIVHHDV